MKVRAALLACVLALLPVLAVAAGTGSAAGQLPLAYQIGSGAKPWTGRLRAVGWQASLAGTGDDRQPVSGLWEAGALLDARQPASRSIYTSLPAALLQPERLVALQWPDLDDSMRERLDIQQLAWLRGDNADPALRPRETRLASARGARVLVVAPPAWQPGKPGHASFRVRHAQRPHMAWLGTVDGQLHGFNAVTGEELAVYLPRTLLPLAAAMVASTAPVAPNPCPRPESTDAVVGGAWRTLVLCAFRGGPEDIAGVFALDITEPDAAPPLRLLWEQAATPALPLAGIGPVRAAALGDGQTRRWHAIALLAPPAEPGLALLPLDTPASSWRMLHVATQGCDGKPSTAALRAVTVAMAFDGTALAAYATDADGQLWRFALGDVLRQQSAPPATCLYRLRGGAGFAEPAPPVVLGTPAQPLVVYAAGNELAAIAEGNHAASQPASIEVRAQGAGFVLQVAPGQGPSAQTAGWHLVLPDANEQVERISLASPGYLVFMTRLPDGRQRTYLVLGATGESVGRNTDGAPMLPFVTGQISEDSPILTREALPGMTPQAGSAGREVHELALWAVENGVTTRLAHVVASRRTGRLAWRELAGPAKETAP
ncbi:PilC/PilY family type IV pilus protein [Cupriavidus consociatus]|uniref:PilC/PilY family type IV pilus protein n=1 Tax=Cupriavidus consociatus TaxID=2821357 RepID=UPI001AE8FC18|nr:MULTISPECIES: PilC/PilY family type IV pilus protein [unclassified Cupriavidus]MBP0621708.1 pilus assembly protein PilY [Cupriavidus sp. LEh25]MDK2658383.1 PilC/PilY family type IV pilus protein [Cupriavidus sp. LEh21]